MKRSEALAPLSRDHHHGLVVAMQLKRASAETAADARRAFLDFFATEGSTHFRVEEEVLLPAYARRGPHDHPAVVRTLVEHVDLRRRGDDVAAAERPDPEALRELGARLERHIRHEERVLFPLVEDALAADELAALGAAIERAEAS